MSQIFDDSGLSLGLANGIPLTQFMTPWLSSPMLTAFGDQHAHLQKCIFNRLLAPLWKFLGFLLQLTLSPWMTYRLKLRSKSYFHVCYLATLKRNWPHYTFSVSFCYSWPCHPGWLIGWSYGWIEPKDWTNGFCLQEKSWSLDWSGTACNTSAKN